MLSKQTLLPLLTVLASLACPLAAASPETDCRSWFEQQQQRLQQLGITDPGTVAIDGFPHLRGNRWLALLQREVGNELEERQWLTLASQVGEDSWRVRLLRADGHQADLDTLAHCSARLAGLTAFPGIPDVEVADNYSTLLRTLGLYALTRHLAQPSINSYRRDMAARFLGARPTPRKHYLPSAFPGSPPPPEELAVNVLDVPAPAAPARQALLAHYAPVLTVGSDAEWDQPGTVRMVAGQPQVDTATPTVYRWLSWTRFRGHNLLQLNYQFWFSKRPADGRMDLYAGELDSLIWRVTLKPDGNVLYYDSIHGCGCYHKVYPVAQGLRPAELADGPVFYPRLASNALTQRVAVQLEPGTHYVVGVQAFNADPQADTTLFDNAAVDDLLAIPDGDGFTSLYDRRGLVSVSKRAERWLLWPLGVPSAGAMRQRGTHAIAFVGRRHFDDPLLPAQIFRQP